MNCETKKDRQQGKVWLVGAGPSDVELITVKGKRLLEEADVIVFDRLVGQGILMYGREDAEYIDVGNVLDIIRFHRRKLMRFYCERQNQEKK